MIWLNTQSGVLPFTNYKPDLPVGQNAKEVKSYFQTDQFFVSTTKPSESKVKYSMTYQAYMEIIETCDDGTLRCKNLSEQQVSSLPIQLKEDDLTDTIQVLIMIQDSNQDHLVEIEVSIQDNITEELSLIAKSLHNVGGIILHNGSAVKQDQSFSSRKVVMNDKLIMIGFVENVAKPQGFCETLGGELWCALGRLGNGIHFVPGYVTQDGQCVIGLLGIIRTVTDFEIYKGQNLAKSQEGYQAQGFVQSTLPLFCAVANTQWGRIPGKVFKDKNICEYVYQSREYSTTDFDLVVGEK